jgi:DNA (cytosine-5)-methyltransferase 1
MGYHQAGFDVLGVDKERQPRYPFTFVQADALEFVARNGGCFDAIHASPPCQRYSDAQRLAKRVHPALVADTRVALRRTHLPYVIENVDGSPLRNPITLCGSQFGLGVYRHRLFETSFGATAPFWSCQHVAPIAKMGRPVRDHEFMHVVGNFSDVQRARGAMEIPWMTRDELREAIPPAFTEYLGQQLIAALEIAA